MCARSFNIDGEAFLGIAVKNYNRFFLGLDYSRLQARSEVTSDQILNKFVPSLTYRLGQESWGVLNSITAQNKLENESGYFSSAIQYSLGFLQATIFMVDYFQAGQGFTAPSNVVLDVEAQDVAEWFSIGGKINYDLEGSIFFPSAYGSFKINADLFYTEIFGSYKYSSGPETPFDVGIRLGRSFN